MDEEAKANEITVTGISFGYKGDLFKVERISLRGRVRA